ncbi:unnamed protein product, partial [Staurois parvus]
GLRSVLSAPNPITPLKPLSNFFTPLLSLNLTIATPSSLADLITGYPLFSLSRMLLPDSSNLPTVSCLPSLSANPSTGLQSVSSTPLCQSLHWPPL